MENVRTTKAYELTEDDCHQIRLACSCAIAKMHEYIEGYKKMGATECVFDCITEINKYERLREKFKKEGE